MIMIFALIEQPYFKHCSLHLHSTSSDDDTSLAELSTAGTSTHASWKDFSAFLDRFPVSLEGKPPTKKRRVESGFPEDRVFYDKWRTTQYTQREEYLLCESSMYYTALTLINSAQNRPLIHCDK